jgi:hypothetical protein
LVDLITNGNFASVSSNPNLNPTGWVVSEQAITDLQTIGGVVNFNSANFANVGASMSQTVTGVPIGETATLQFTYSDTGLLAGSKQVLVSILDGNGNVIYSQTIGTAGTYTHSFTAATNDYTIRFLDTSDTALLGNPQIDNVSFDVPFVVCFCRDTLILTEQGQVPVQDLRPGDRVITLDAGPQPIRWISARRVDATGSQAPIRLKQGSFGNSADLLVSPQHRILLRDWRAELLFGSAEVLVAARDLVNDLTVRPSPTPQLEYHHFMFDRHQIVCANGIWSESFFPGSFALRALERPARDELLGIFPELARDPSRYGALARPGLARRQAALLA